MRHELSDIGHSAEIRQTQIRKKDVHSEDFVLEKSIFNNVFEKDIRRVFIYKKAERLAKAIHLISPAFAGSDSLRQRIDAIAIGLVDAAIAPPAASRTALSRELLALSSVLSIARTGGLLSFMNAELITREAHILLQEVAAYEEPRLLLDDAPTLSDLAKGAAQAPSQPALKNAVSPASRPARRVPTASGREHIKDIKAISDTHIKDRQEAVLSVIRNKRKASIKDISTVIRGVSEKTIQRELLSLVSAGLVVKQGERRWSTYQLAG